MTASERQLWRHQRRQARKDWVAALAASERQQLQNQLAGIVVPHLGEPATLAGYAAVGSELGVDPLLQAAERLGWTIALPRASPGEPLTFHRISGVGDAGNLVPGPYRTPEPAANLPEICPDVVLVPLLAADRRGHRLGQGGGHYDRTLAKLRAMRRILAIGIAWDMQIVAEIATESWDQQVDAIATPTAFLLTGAGAIRPLSADLYRS